MSPQRLKAHNIQIHCMQAFFFGQALEMVFNEITNLNKLKIIINKSRKENNNLEKYVPGVKTKLMKI